ncbi:DUF2147 domain-containing protein [Rhizobium oryzicola]|uniref:DUF2147 domain-containing protein n=1 Tax=Rhizobium oryzicola TaxID=1232668 RepID=A0ABT8ST62_9HYPH|nr:DUF2147 domain-containing protein [Rhizobium oryzicola]MDO1581610.1 DUF2147 domain-containing protein [Rhizobium oryzicola]
MIRTMSLTFSVLLSLSGVAMAAEPIEGNWKTESGATAAITSCGGAFCVTLKTGEYAGKQIGKLSGKGKEYTGEITDPEDDKTYEGSGSVNGNSLKMKGCVLKIFCKSQTWTRL